MLYFFKNLPQDSKNKQERGRYTEGCDKINKKFNNFLMQLKLGFCYMIFFCGYPGCLLLAELHFYIWEMGLQLLEWVYVGMAYGTFNCIPTHKFSKHS